MLAPDDYVFNLLLSGINIVQIEFTGTTAKVVEGKI